MAQRIPGNEPELVGLFGVGLDGDDGHKRLTTGDNFILLGGSDDTHDRMIDTAVHLNESLRRLGKTLHDASPDELIELLREASARRRCP